MTGLPRRVLSLDVVFATQHRRSKHCCSSPGHAKVIFCRFILLLVSLGVNFRTLIDCEVAARRWVLEAQLNCNLGVTAAFTCTDLASSTHIVLWFSSTERWTHVIFNVFLKSGERDCLVGVLPAWQATITAPTAPTAQHATSICLLSQIRDQDKCMECRHSYDRCHNTNLDRRNAAKAESVSAFTSRKRAWEKSEDSISRFGTHEGQGLREYAEKLPETGFKKLRTAHDKEIRVIRKDDSTVYVDSRNSLS